MFSYAQHAKTHNLMRLWRREPIFVSIIQLGSDGCSLATGSPCRHRQSILSLVLGLPTKSHVPPITLEPNPVLCKSDMPIC